MWRGLRDAFSERRRKSTIILLVITPLLLVWKYYGSPEALAAAWDNAPGGSPASSPATLHFLLTLAMLGVAPAALVKFGLGERLGDYGLGLGIRVRTVRSFLVLAPLFVLAGWVGAGDPAVAAKFPLNPQAGASPAAFAVHAGAYFLYYVGWEFCFRGFLLFGLRDSMGDAAAVLVQTMASSLLHIGGPASETLGAVPAGILWGALAIRTGSIWSGLGQHYLLGLAVDWTLAFPV